MGGACCASNGALATFAKSHLDEHFGVGTADALQRLAELLTRVEVKIGGGRLMTNPFMVNLGMVLKQVEKERRYKRPLTSGTAFEDAKVLRKAARYARYAMASYYCDKRSIADYVGNLHTEDVKHIHSSSIVMSPGYFIAIDQETDDIVLCIRGAGSSAEALGDAVFPKDPLLGGRAHAGMLEHARVIAEGAGKTLTRLSQESPRKGIAIVGHSLGGGVALLATILLSAEGCPFAKLMATGKVKCYAFAPPPCFEPLWALPSWVHSSCYSFVYNMDCVPRACVGTISKLYLALKHVDELPISAEKRMAYLRGEGELDHVLPDYMEVPQDLNAVVGSLFVVGTIVCLYRGESGQLRCETAAPHMMDRILLHPDMVHDHAMTCFEEAFEDLRAQLASMDGCAIS